jgi:ketosteroid isomerase-like protein
MDARDEITLSDATAQRNLEAVKAAYARIDTHGVVSGIEQLLTVCHPDVEMRPYAAQVAGSPGGSEPEVLRGHDEVLAFFRGAHDQGFELTLRTREFAVEGDSLVVRGSIRVNRPDGSFAETSVSWNYHFRDGLVDEISWEPRAGA